MRDLAQCTTFYGASLREIVEHIDNFLACQPSFEDAPLIMTATGSSCRHTHKGVTIRQWSVDGNIRFDAAIQLKVESDV